MPPWHGMLPAASSPPPSAAFCSGSWQQDRACSACAPTVLELACTGGDRGRCCECQEQDVQPRSGQAVHATCLWRCMRPRQGPKQSCLRRVLPLARGVADARSCTAARKESSGQTLLVVSVTKTAGQGRRQTSARDRVREEQRHRRMLLDAHLGAIIAQVFWHDSHLR